MKKDFSDTHSVPLSWARQDIEQRLFFKGGRYTQTNTGLCLLIALFGTITFYGVLFLVRDSAFARTFLVAGDQASGTFPPIIPLSVVYFTCWGIAILLIKRSKLRHQRQALSFSVIPVDVDFVLSPLNASDVIERTYEIAEEPKQFLLYHRIGVALANLRNLGRISDVDDILRSQAENDESSLESTYSLLAGLIWAIPVLGFIGTVLGLSDAIGGFTAVLKDTSGSGESSGMSDIKNSLMGVTGGLKDAFVTTLQALVAALFLQMSMTFLKKTEHEFLDECREYCLNYIVNRLRMVSQSSPLTKD